MAERSSPTWPHTPDGKIDWETVFEHPETGLISLITRAPSAAALRKSTVFVIRSVYSEDESATELKYFVREIEGMLPDDLPPAMLPKLSEAVASILRDIKLDRIRRSETPPVVESAKSSVPPRGVVRKRPRSAWSPAQIIAAVFAVLLVVGGGAGATYYYGFMDHEVAMTARIKKLIAEMESAAAGQGPDHHEFGWGLTVERRAGLIGVTAVGVPVDACTSAAWYFVNRGNVVINDRMPEKVAPSVLKRFCGEKGQRAKLLWLSEDKGQAAPTTDATAGN
ncbi:MAG: hypothetical protein RIC16_15910 [Rhodospirillales bacterium]